MLEIRSGGIIILLHSGDVAKIFHLNSAVLYYLLVLHFVNILQ